MKTKKKSSYFSYKNDDVDLVELGQFLRETTGYRVEREWHILFVKYNGTYGTYFAYTKTVPDNPIYKSRNPDLILIDIKTGELKLVIEIDGSVHDHKLVDTEKRNEQYKKAGIPLLVINKLEIDTTIFDYVTRKIQERLCI